MASRVKVSYLSLDSFWRHNKDRHGRDLLSPWAHRIRRINSYSCMIPVISMTLSTDLSAIDLKNLLLLKANRKALLRATTQWIPTALLASHQLPVGAKEEKKGHKCTCQVNSEYMSNIKFCNTWKTNKDCHVSIIFLESPDKLRSDGLKR